MNFLPIYRFFVSLSIVVLLIVCGYACRGLIGDSLIHLYSQPFLIRCWTSFSFAISTLLVLCFFLLGICVGFFFLILCYAVLQEIYYQLMVRRVFRSFFEWLFQFRKKENE